MRDTVKTSTKQARAMRRAMPYAEKRLWQCLRARRLDGYRFRRQHPISRFIVDFACLSERLVIEVDGVTHDTPQTRERDACRTRALEAAGWTVIRFSNVDVFDRLDWVVTEIGRRLPPQSASLTAPPQAEERAGASISPS